MAEETVTPVREAVEVTDVRSASQALDNLMNPEEGQPIDDQPDQVEQEDAPINEEPAELEVADDGDDSEEAEEQLADDGEEQDVFEVTLPGGEKAEVTLDELAKGYSRQSDYTRKTEQVAAERRELAAERDTVSQAVENERQQYQAALAELVREAGINLQREENVDWDKLRDEDPIEFASKWADHQRKVEAYRASQYEMGRQQQQNEAAQKAQHGEFLQQQRVSLVEMIPDFANTEKAEAMQNNMREFLTSSYGGFEDAEINNIVDARHVALINDAMQWRKLQSQAVATTKKVSRLPKIVKPSASRGRSDVDAEQSAKLSNQARRSGSVEDAAAALEGLFG